MVPMQLAEASFLEFYEVKGHMHIEYASTVSFNMVIDDNGVLLLLPTLYKRLEFGAGSQNKNILLVLFESHTGNTAQLEAQTKVLSQQMHVASIGNSG